MVNTKGGSKYKKHKKGKGKTDAPVATQWADSPGLMYAIVKSKLGGRRLTVECNDGKQRQAVIPGSFYKRVWFNPNDVILLQLNETDITEGFILCKYNPDEVRELKIGGKLEFEVKEAALGDNIVFGDEADEDEDEEEDVHREVEKELQNKELQTHEKRLKQKEADQKKMNDRSKKITENEDSGNFDFDSI